MLFEFALTPDVIEDAITSPHINDQYIVVELLKHFKENGLLVDLRNGEWKNYINQLLIGMAGGYKEELIALFVNLENLQRIVPHNASPNWVSWLDEATYSKSCCHSICGIILASNNHSKLGSPPSFLHPFPPPPASSTAWNNWQGIRSKTVYKCEADFRSALDPILHHASRVDLIDPYFNCQRDEYQRTIRLCVDLLNRDQTCGKKIVIHAGDPNRDVYNPEPPSNRLRTWMNFLQSLRSTIPITVQIFLWANIKHERPHNRYIFTNQHVGIHNGDGLDCHDPACASKDLWEVMDVRSADQFWQDFTSVPRFQRLEQPVSVRIN